VPSALLFVNSIASQYLTPDELSEYSARYASILPRIVIEITEEECLDPKALRIKQTIRGSSGAFALDDYGSERSLLELSPNYIKIDLSIIRSIDTDANKRQIVSNTVSYAHQRGMKVVAEGLETADEVRTVLSLGVDLLQGFFLAMPQVEPGGASEESLAVIAEMHSQSDESQISIFGGDKQ
jgi:EAL domain-containing protein (putative c-di-GMP-specific phosphodiesterase class I)